MTDIDHGAMSIGQFLTVLVARRWSALAVVLGLVALVAIYSLMQPRQYQATAAVLIDTRSPDPVQAANGGNYNLGSGYIATQVDLMQSERVALKAQRALHLQDDRNWRQIWVDATGGRGEFEPWLAENLVKKLDIRPSRESSVVNFTYTATDPAFAAQVANAFVRSYIDTTLELKVEPARQYNAFFDERATQLRTALEQAQARLSRYQQAKGIVATDDRLDLENARLAELSSQVVLLQGLATEASSRQVQAGSSSQEVVSNVLIGTLTSDLSRQEARLGELRQRLGERNPQVIELAANVEQMRSRLESETKRVSRSIGVNSNVERSRLAAAQAALAAQRAKVLALRGQRDEASVLVRDVDSAQKAYDAALSRVNQTRLESQNTLTNVSVLKTATPPAVATSPRVLLNTAVAAVVGSLLALGFVFLREWSDRRLRFETDVTQALQQPLLVTIPFEGERALRHRARLALSRPAVNPQPMPQGGS